MIGRLVARERLEAPERAGMYALLSRHFDGLSPATFDRDLDEKNWVVLITDDGVLKGFTTLLAYDTAHGGEPISVVYSGDTIMDQRAWNSSALPRAWGAAVRALRESCLQSDRLYWLLLTSGFRTYRLLPVFWREFYPRCDAPTPAPAQALLTALAAERLGACYDAGSGIVRFAAPQVLHGSLKEVAPGRSDDPHVAFFLERNPGWANGDELVCLARIAFDNLTPAGRRMWGAERRDIVPAERVG